MTTAVPMPSGASPGSLCFGASSRFELQAAERRLLIDGRPAALGGRALDLLITLAGRPDHLMTKGELLDRVWPGLVVEEGNLQVQVSNLRKLLGGEVIATVPGRGYRFVARLSSGPAAPGPAAVESTPAPAPPRLVGRDADLARLDALLQGDGCVTLVGPAGVGKTSLARAAAARWDGERAWVDLAALAEGAQPAGAVARAAARTLGMTPAAGDAGPQLLCALEGRALLLVLDNAEHLVDSCAALATLLRPLAGVRLLVTSQLPLAVAGERVQRLEPLALPSAGQAARGTSGAPMDPADPASLGDGALALLVERIVAADHRFQPTPAALPALCAICEQLDGLPLAIEMAAARVPVLGLGGVRDALGERFALLTRGHRDAAWRHRTLHHALAWSYRLLGPAEQRLFRALGVFAGGFTLELAVALAAEGPDARWDVIDQLATLVDRSLVVVSAEDPPRYRLLETLRAYALAQLDEAGEALALRARHAAALLALYMRHEPGDTALQALCTAEMENAREAVSWAALHELGTAARLSARVTRVATFTVWRYEAFGWLQALEVAMEAAMEQPPGQALPAEVQAAWWTELGRVLFIGGQARANAVARRALSLWRPLQQPRQALFAAVACVRSHLEPGPGLDEACAELQALGDSIPDLSPRERLWMEGALVAAARSRRDFSAVLAGRLAEMGLAQQQGWRAEAEAAESNVVDTLNLLGRHAEAAERGGALLRRIDGRDGDANGNLPWVLNGLMVALIQRDRLDEARALVPRALVCGQRFGTLVCRPTLALLAAAGQRHEAAARLVGHARQACSARGTRLDFSDEETLAHVQALAAEALGLSPAQALIEQGRGLDDEAAAALGAAENGSDDALESTDAAP